MVALKARQNYEWSELPDLQDQAYNSQMRANEAFYNSVGHRIRSVWTRLEIEALVNDGKPIATHPRPWKDALGRPRIADEGLLHDPETGGETVISFDAMTGEYLSQTLAYPRIMPPSPTAAWKIGEYVRAGGIIFASVGWCLLMVALPFVCRYVRRLVMGQLLLGLAILWLAAEMVLPTRLQRPYLTTWSPVNASYHFGLGWPVAAAVIGIIVMALGITKTPPDPNLCIYCSYNLTDNVSGICPECGNPIAPQVSVMRP